MGGGVACALDGTVKSRPEGQQIGQMEVCHFFLLLRLLSDSLGPRRKVWITSGTIGDVHTSHYLLVRVKVLYNWFSPS